MKHLTDRRWLPLAIALLAGMLTLRPARASPMSLEDAVSTAVSTAPEITAARARAAAAAGGAEQAGRWPNPRIGLGMSDRLDKQLQTGENDLTEISVSQSLPIGGRLHHAQEAAEARSAASQALAAAALLELEYRISLRFHAVQLQQARYRLSHTWLEETDVIRHIGEERAAAGDLSTLERMRLDLVREQAHQHQQTVESAYEDALAQLRPYLGVPAGQRIAVTALAPAEPPPPVDSLRASLDAHPLQQAMMLETEATRAEVAATRAGRIADWEVEFRQEKEAIAGQEDTVSTINLTIPLPLWDRRSGAVREALANTEASIAEQTRTRRDLEAQLVTAHAHIGHLQQQLEHFRTKVLEPAERVYSLTRTGFMAGEVDLLALIDATRAWFDANERHLDLLYEIQLEVAHLRRAAGLSVLATPVN